MKAFNIFSICVIGRGWKKKVLWKVVKKLKLNNFYFKRGECSIFFFSPKSYYALRREENGEATTEDAEIFDGEGRT